MASTVTSPLPEPDGDAIADPLADADPEPHADSPTPVGKDHHHKVKHAKTKAHAAPARPSRVVHQGKVNEKKPKVEVRRHT